MHYQLNQIKRYNSPILFLSRNGLAWPLSMNDGYIMQSLKELTYIHQCLCKHSSVTSKGTSVFVRDWENVATAYTNCV